MPSPSPQRRFVARKYLDELDTLVQDLFDNAQFIEVDAVDDPSDTSIDGDDRLLKRESSGTWV